jgi:phosphatidylglycerol---prolipoprotein diacylglyceryl transferase
VFAWVYLRRNNLPFFGVADAFAPGVALGHAIGRLGCFAAGCCWGSACDKPWAVTFTDPEAAKLVGVPLNVPLHPAQIYESAAELLLCYFLYTRFLKKHGSGEIIALYLILYSVIRIAVEFVRNHEQALPFGLPFSLTQWIAAGTLLIGIWWYRRAGAAA